MHVFQTQQTNSGFHPIVMQGPKGPVSEFDYNMIMKEGGLKERNC